MDFSHKTSLKFDYNKYITSPVWMYCVHHEIGVKNHKAGETRPDGEWTEKQRHWIQVRVSRLNSSFVCLSL